MPDDDELPDVRLMRPDRTHREKITRPESRKHAGAFDANGEPAAAHAREYQRSNSERSETETPLHAEMLAIRTGWYTSQ